MRTLCLVLLLIFTGCGEGGSSSGGTGSGSSQGSAFTAVAVETASAVQANSVLLLHFNANLIDASTRHNVTNTASTSDVATARFGSGSRYFNGASRLDLDNQGDFDIANNKFEITLYMKTSTVGATQYLFGQFGVACVSSENTVSVFVNPTNKLVLSINSNGINFGITSVNVVTDGAWHKVRVGRNNGTGYMYIDEVSQGTLINLLATPASLNDFTIGRPGECTGNYFTGNIDEFHMTMN